MSQAKLRDKMKKLIIVTGATKGLGVSITKRLLKEGYQVIGIGRKKGEEFLRLEKEFSEALCFKEFDLMNVDRIHGLIKEITSERGNIYGLVNNAAIGHDGILATMHENSISDLIKLNIEAPIVFTKYASRSMLINMSGRIINISSIISKTGFNGLSVYGASKAALNGFSKSLARELGKANITVNTICPGYMETEMTSALDNNKLESIVRRSPMKKLVSVDDVASMCAFLISDEAKLITGAEFTIDAGSTA
jgi:3-oxoacyl-[acyl-carrier protein] reductase